MAVSVTIGGTPATSVEVTDDGTLTAVVPAGTAGTADVVVTTSGGSATLADGFEYTDVPPEPTVDGITPATGDVAGGTAVTITGSGFNE